MVVDTSAIIAISSKETGYPALSRAIANASACFISTATVLETYLVIRGRMGQAAWGDVFALIESCCDIMPVSEEVMKHAMVGFQNYGKGGGSGAKLNYGDCFSYGLAKSLDEPLLFVGGDFSKTDIKLALNP